MSNGNGWLAPYTPLFLNQCDTSGYVFLPQPAVSLTTMTRFMTNAEHLKATFKQYFDELIACNLDLASTMPQFIRNLKQSLSLSESTFWRFYNIEIIEAAISFGDDVLLEEVVKAIGSVPSEELFSILTHKWAWRCDTSILLRLLNQNRVGSIYISTYMDTTIKHAFKHNKVHVLVELQKRIDWLTDENLLTCVAQHSELSYWDKATHVIDDLFAAKFQGWNPVAILKYIEALSRSNRFWYNQVFTEWGLDETVRLHESHRIAHALSPWLQSDGDIAAHVNETRVAITNNGIEHCKNIIADFDSSYDDILMSKQNLVYVFNLVGWPVDAPVFRDLIDFLQTPQSIYEYREKLPIETFSNILDNLPADKCDHLNRLFITYEAMAYEDVALVQKAVAKMNITADELASLESDYFYEKNRKWGITGCVLTMLAAAGYGVKLSRDSARAAKRANEILPFEIALLSQLEGQYGHAIEDGIQRFIPAPAPSTAFPRRSPHEKPFAASRFREQELAYAMGIMAHLPNYLQEEVASFLPSMQTFLQAEGKTRGNYYLAKAKALEARRQDPQKSKCTIL